MMMTKITTSPTTRTSVVTMAGIRNGCWGVSTVGGTEVVATVVIVVVTVGIIAVVTVGAIVVVTLGIIAVVTVEVIAVVSVVVNAAETTTIKISQ